MSIIKDDFNMIRMNSLLLRMIWYFLFNLYSTFIYDDNLIIIMTTKTLLEMKTPFELYHYVVSLMSRFYQCKNEVEIIFDSNIKELERTDNPLILF